MHVEPSFLDSLKQVKKHFPHTRVVSHQIYSFLEHGTHPSQVVAN